MARQLYHKQNRARRVVVLSEAPLPGQGISRNAQELAQLTETARLLGCQIVPLPPEGAAHASAEEALAALGAVPYSPPAHTPTLPSKPVMPGIWIGSIPTLVHYRAVYRAARAQGIHLVNSPAQHQRALEGDRALVMLGDLTPE